MTTVYSLVTAQFKRMSDKGGELYVLDIDVDVIWNTYLNSFKPEHNQIFRKRPVHDCATCRAFIKNLGATVAIIDGKRESIWDITPDAEHAPSFEAVRELLKGLNIVTTKRFLAGTTMVGNVQNTEITPEGPLTWNHYHAPIDPAYTLPRGMEVVKHSNVLGERFTMLTRSVTEISYSAIDTVIELAEDNNVYRLSEFQHFAIKLRELKTDYDTANDKTVWALTTLTTLSDVYVNIRGSLIGGMLELLTKGVDVEDAVKAYGSRIDNYRTPKADLITERQHQEAVAFCEEHGLTESIPRRPAIASDIGVADVLYVDQTTRDVLIPSPLDGLVTQNNIKPKGITSEMSIEDFIANVLPKASDLEILVESRLRPRFMALTIQSNLNAPQLLSWANGASWSYHGDVADTRIAEAVSDAGGKVQNVAVRASLLWNDQVPCNSDLDIHCVEPGQRLEDHQHIFFEYKGRTFNSSGSLDVDVMNPRTGIPAVENIVHTSLEDMPAGEYKYFVHNYSKRNGTEAFVVEFAFNGSVYHSVNTQAMPANAMALVAVVTKAEDGSLSILDGHGKPMLEVSYQTWGLDTAKYHKVSLASLSPNHWTAQHDGNKHYFFFIDGCKSTEKIRTLHNEHLIAGLRPHRKVFQALGMKSKVDATDDGLCGLGFSDTVRNNATFRATVDGRPHTITVKF